MQLRQIAGEVISGTRVQILAGIDEVRLSLAMGHMIGHGKLASRETPVLADT